MNKIILVLSVILFFPLVIFAQENSGVIKGTVTNDRQPVTGANVALEEIQKGTATDSEGKFIIKKIKPGTYQLSVSAVGYARFDKEIVIEASETVELNIELTQTLEELDEVVVTGTMRETFVKESPVKVAVVTPKRLQQGKTSSNIMDLIGGVNGLSTQLNCGVCGTNAIRINGVEGPNTAVLIDGMPIMGALASVYGLNGISPSIIDQVEVIKGPQSTLYGTEALGGVVNILTKDPSNTPTFSADVYVKSTEETNINLAASPEIGRFEGFVSANGLHNGNFVDHNGDNFNDLVQRSHISIFGKGMLKDSDGNQRLTIATKYLDENRTGGVRKFSDEIRGSDTIYGESIYTRRAELLTDYRPDGFDQRLRFNGALTYHDQDSYYGTEHYVAEQGIIYGQATWDQTITDNLQFLSGATARYQTYKDNTPATSDGVNRRFIPGIFGQSELTMGDVMLLGGLRADNHSEHGIITSPRFSVKYSPGERSTLRVNGGTGFRVVNVFTEDHAALTGSREVVFTEDLDPERSKSITAGFEHIFPFEANPLTVNLDGFYTRFSNKIIPDYDQDPNLIVYENLDGFSLTRGFSVEVDQNFTALPVSYNANFTWMDVFTEENGQRQALAYAPDFMGSIGITYQLLPMNLAVDYTVNLMGPKRMPDNYVQDFGRDRWSPTHSIHNIKITKEFSNVNNPNRSVGIEAYLSAENIFDFTQGSPLVDVSDPFGPQFDTIYTWGPIVGRTFSLGARLNLR